ncbi:YkvA family protein [Brevibacillus ruminantium]|uniref:YkvA family protein n=1 Tax=Brevibacillus ruminantium TaxID=2950604 RepID=A0ABY4WJR8_9BACL|nr:YkvA family protein [Brevibacillus ruminantium]USG67380.1 YkvA family protein [Brevibacillus ruminantium]
MTIVFKDKARLLKRDAFVLYFAYKDHRVAWYAKLFAICVVAYAFSPIDLIPDFIPILGYLDDIILVPLGIWLALKYIPKEVLRDCRAKAQELILSTRAVLTLEPKTSHSWNFFLSLS